MALVLAIALLACHVWAAAEREESRALWGVSGSGDGTPDAAAEEGRQVWRVYYANPRTASIFLTERLVKYGNPEIQILPVEDQGMLERLFPRFRYKTTRGGALWRLIMFLVPAPLTLGTKDSFETLWKTTHDRRVIPVIVADEFCENFFEQELSGGVKSWPGSVMRNYWDDNIINMTDSKQWSSVVESKRVRYLPLSPRFEFEMVTDEERKPVTSRKYLFNMMMSLSTNQIRIDLDKKVKELQVQYPGGGTNADSASGGSLPGLGQSFIHNAMTWQTNLPKEVIDGQAMPADEYRQVLLDSVFTLSPSGHNPETFRLFEAAEAGSIPIVDYSTRSGNCKNPWRPFKMSQAPFVWVDDWTDIQHILEDLISDPARVIQMQKDLMEWYHSFMHDAVFSVEETMREHLADWLVHGRSPAGQPLPSADLISLHQRPRKERRNTNRASRRQQRLFELDFRRRRLLSSGDADHLLGSEGALKDAPVVPLVTGCGRAGTHTAAALLNSFGVPAIHEGADKDSVAVSWLYAPEDSGRGLSTGRQKALDKRSSSLKKTGVRFHPVVFITRHPLSQIESTGRCFCASGFLMSEKQIMWDRLSWEYADRYLNFPPGISRLHRAALYWLEWNALSERHADYQFRIEDLNPRRMVQLLGVQDRMALPLSEVPEALHLRSSSLEQATNGRVNRTQLTWEALEEEVGAELTERIKKAAVRYGYSLDATR